AVNIKTPGKLRSRVSYFHHVLGVVGDFAVSIRITELHTTGNYAILLWRFINFILGIKNANLFVSVDHTNRPSYLMYIVSSIKTTKPQYIIGSVYFKHFTFVEGDI